MEHVADPDGVVEERAVGDAEVGVEVGEDVVQRRIAEEEEAEETGGDVHSRAQQQRRAHYRPDLRRILELLANWENCRSCYSIASKLPLHS